MELQEFVQQYAWLIPVLVVWSLVWKGLALWRAAKDGQKGWFVALLVINTLGILEIIYIYGISRRPVQE